MGVRTRAAAATAGIVASLLVVVVIVAGCAVRPGDASGAPSNEIPIGDSAQSLSVGGLARDYRIHRPGTTGQAMPLVIMLHGGYGSAAQAQRSYSWDAQADRGGFIVAYPDGVARSWNAGSCCGPAQSRNVDDVAFIGAVVADITRRGPIDPRRIYVTGMSNGAMMALRLACQTTLFAAVAPVAGTLLTGCGSAAPTSVLQIHGTADGRVLYTGGPGEAFNLDGTARVDGPPVPEVSATWRRIDGCAAPTSTVEGPVTRETAACPSGRAVELISVAGAGHQWPGAPGAPVLERTLGTDPPSDALDATATIWRFFATHPAPTS